MTTARQTLNNCITEADFQAQVVQLAKLCNWLCYHTYNSQRSTSGYPDLTLCKGNRIIMIEVKTERGRLSPSQRMWLSALQEAGVDARCWRPSDWCEVEATLRG